MGFKALNKTDNKIYSLDYWQRTFTNETPYCPVCDEITEIRAAGSVYMKTHFFHKKGTYCPSVRENHSKYELLPPTERDTKNGEKIINWIRVNISQLYTKCKKILNGRLRFKEFSDMLVKAKEKNIWFYKNLTINTLPYVLIVNFGVYPKIDGRREDVWYIFDKDMYGDTLFLRNKITHIWKVTESELERIELDYIPQDTVPDYVWTYVKPFYK
ncbi:hypothetical protein LAV73_20710 [Lysinibacillus xylanilyticus]|uniref:hypothetical protein n=1 Tax=Lysinibacillus xylanilyticus TaxID=582475 RepID=UPI002B24E435|nr:hypothetical protein [Lysinibacillus xylanilyticus]MEB2282376.1 hypothetical protein [Lysinibacillus xylanilyticus]